MTSYDTSKIKFKAPKVLTEQAVHIPAFPYAGAKTETITLEKGHKRYKDSRALPGELIYMKDQTFTHSDGVKIYYDVFLPAGYKKIPGILHWGPYGKSSASPLGLRSMEDIYHAGVANESLSDYNNWEGLDPAEWCTKYNFAIINVDPRGIFSSEGNQTCGEQEGKDGAELIAHLAEQEWCSGKIGMAGNSWLAMVQYDIAAQSPPALACIAPAEGTNDRYRDSIAYGGVYARGFVNFIYDGFCGRSKVEDLPGMFEKDTNGLFDDYWKSKVVDLEKIKCPIYGVASYSTGLHTRGSVDCFLKAGSEKKWLRFHDTQEWSDLYEQTNQDEMAMFFNRYLRDEQNDWEKTPKVRLCALGMNSRALFMKGDVYPPRNTEYKQLYLSEKGLEKEPVSGSAQAKEFNAASLEREDELYFDYKFEESAVVAGYAKAVLYVSSAVDELDLHLQLQKVDKNGEQVDSLNFRLKDIKPLGYTEPLPLEKRSNPMYYRGPRGDLKLSHRETLVKKGEVSPYYAHDSTSPVTPNEVYKVEIAFWPMGMTFEAGEAIRLAVAGHAFPYPEFLFLAKDNDNKGKAKVHFQGDCESFIQIPIVQPENTYYLE